MNGSSALGHSSEFCQSGDSGEQLSKHTFMLDLKPQTHCSKNKRLVCFNVGWISARNQATENSSKATIRDPLRAIQLV